ncbi:MAG: fibronectin type III domain-containing protein, partial [bacterium]|nr:fibronectin type III domain-containing protein [bacterium]
MLSADEAGVARRCAEKRSPLGGRARLLLLLPVLALLLGALLPAPAAAQTTIVWSATLTVDQFSVHFGCSNGVLLELDNCSSSTVLTKDEFTYRGTTYQIQDLYWASNRLYFGLTGRSGAVLKTALGSLTLNVDGRQLAVRHASQFTDQVAWDFDPATDWTDGQKVRLSLTEPDGLPGKPTGARVRAGDSQVTLHYLSSDGYPGKQYRQRVGSNAWGSWTNIPESRSGGKNRRSYTLTGLNNGTAYSFQLRDVNHIGAGPPSDVLGPVTPAVAPLPAHIDGLRARPSTDEDDGSVTLRWNDPHDGSITKYQVNYRSIHDSSTTWTDIRNSNSQTARHTVTGLIPRSPYVFRVRAVNATGNGPASDEVTATPGSVERHGVRLWNFRVEPGDDRLALRWQVVSNSNQSSRVFYVVRWREAASRRGASTHEFASWDNRPGYTITGLKPGTLYDVELSVLADGVTSRPAWSQQWSTTGTSMAPAVGAPALQWARVNGAELGLRFDKELDASSVPAGSAFAVSVAGSARGVSSVEVRQDLVSLTLASAVSAGDSVTVGYTPPSTGKLRLPGGGAEVAAFSGVEVGNDTPAGQRQAAAPQAPPGGTAAAHGK